MASNQKTNNFLNSEIINDNVNKFSSNDQYHRQRESGSKNIIIIFLILFIKI